jgi:hypothetical protein
MLMQGERKMKKIKLLVILALLGLMSACSQAPQTTSPELTVLTERAAIEDLFIDYYAQFRPDSRHDFMSFFTADGRLEVNGMVAKGIDEIKAMYAQAGVGSEKKEPKAEDAIPKGVSEMILSNMKIDVQGDKAVATFLWHSIKAELVTTEGKITEYGRERSELVKKDGRWLISSRYVLTEGGMPESLLQYYPKK